MFLGRFCGTSSDTKGPVRQIRNVSPVFEEGKLGYGINDMRLLVSRTSISAPCLITPLSGMMTTPSDMLHCAYASSITPQSTPHFLCG